jgi:nicotinamidase-related amidase
MPTTGIADALIVIDMQKGFLRRQPELVEKVHDLTLRFPAGSTYWLKYRNYPGSPFIRHLGWGEMMGPPETDFADLLKPDPKRTYSHESYSLPVDLLSVLKPCRAVALAGTDTDACIQAAAFDLWNHNIHPLIVEPCCGSSEGAHFHKSSIDIMRRQFGTQAIVNNVVPRLEESP